jgi:predicted nucleotidyltransferase
MSYSAEIKKFKDALVKSDIGHEITKVVWFGSTLKKKAHRDSDVDILIVTKAGKRIQDRIADILLDFQMNNRTPVEIVTSSVDDLYPIIDPFLKNILQYGQEVYSMPEKDLKVTAASHYLSLAQEFYDSAEDSIKRDFYRLGLDGAYNSAELAAKGFLCHENIGSSRVPWGNCSTVR